MNKKKIKEFIKYFFKPDWRKILLFIIISTSLFFSFFGMMTCNQGPSSTNLAARGIDPSSYEPAPLSQKDAITCIIGILLFLVIIGPAVILNRFLINTYYSLSYQIYPYILILVLYWYSLSCLLIFIFDVLKSRLWKKSNYRFLKN